MNHRVRSVQDLYISAEQLYDEGVLGEQSGADGILRNLSQGIENLKQNWKGVDAGFRIQEVITVHNEMVKVRNNLVDLAVESSKVASYYRNIQNTNSGGRLDNLQAINTEHKSNLGDYFDTADTIDINPEAAVGKTCIDNAVNALDGFESLVRAKKNEIMDNWTDGPGRHEADSAFETYMSKIKSYKAKLAEVSANVTNALQNYNF